MTEKEAAPIVGLSVRTLQALRVKGGGPEYLKLGTAVRYELSALEAWIKGCARTSTSGEPQTPAPKTRKSTRGTQKTT